MEQFIKVEIGKLKKHHNKRFDKLEKGNQFTNLLVGIATVVLVILELIKILGG